MKTREWLAHIYKINNYIPHFPGENLTKLEDNKMKEIAKDGIPIDWQTQMSLQNFDVTGKRVPEFIDFCEHLELLEENGENDNAKKSHTTNKNKHKRHRNDQNNSGNKDTEHYCMLHSKNSSHSTEDCNTLKKMVKKQKDNTLLNHILKLTIRQNKQKLMPWSLKPLRLSRRRNPRTRKRSKKS